MDDILLGGLLVFHRPVLLEQLEKWALMSIERKIPYVRAVQAARLLAQRFFHELEFELKYKAFFQFLQAVTLDCPQLRMHWRDFDDGTKWIYFCMADVPEKRHCSRCLYRVECLVTP